ncbi:MAG: DEAD/DEAH box helicase family protein, partial [Chloroflexi bacterium]|nr:DEAD/DEAH box helicase family protein [Chloroflexota bacterium]
MNLADLLDQYGEAIARTVIESYPPLYDGDVRRSASADLRRLLRRPLGAQVDAINATALSLKQSSGTFVVGEMGTGKSYIAAAAAYLAVCRRILVVSPPHLVKKWQREVKQTVPGAHAMIVRTIGDLESLRTSVHDRQFVICSRERAKLGYRWMPAVVDRPARDTDGGIARCDDGRIDSLLCCPSCFAPVSDDEDVPLTLSELRVKKRRCRACGESLWQADRTGPRRVPLAEYVRRRMPGYFDLLVLDEGHEYKARGSAQGLAAESLSGACARTLTLTGTLFGGYSSTLFYLLWRFSPAVRRDFGYRDESKWISRFGIVERVLKKSSDAYGDDGRHSKRRSYQARTIEKPGVSPSVLFHLIGNTVFLRLADVSSDLPPYTERVVICDLLRGADASSPSQAEWYERLARDLRQATVSALSSGSKRLLATYLQTLLAYPDACTRATTVTDVATGSIIAQAPALPDDTLYPKEQALVDLALRERTRGRRLLIYITHTERRDISPRLQSILERAGLRVDVLKADTVAPDRREDWLAARVREGTEVLICHPRLVQTGLDLIDWPSICWFETEYSVYVMRQASRRSWRIGQRQAVEV